VIVIQVFFFTLHDLGLIVRSYIFFVRPGT